MQYMDADFNEFMNLTSVSEIQNKSTLKVIYLSVLPPEEPYITLYTVESPAKTSGPTNTEPQVSTSSIASSCSDDTLYTSTPCSSPCSSPDVNLSGLSSWPRVFVIPKFTYEAEFELQKKYRV